MYLCKSLGESPIPAIDSTNGNATLCKSLGESAVSAIDSIDSNTALADSLGESAIYPKIHIDSIHLAIGSGDANAARTCQALPPVPGPASGAFYRGPSRERT